MTTLAWKINRIRLMGGAELGWRVAQIVQKKAARLGLGLRPLPPAPGAGYGRAFLPAA
ncbi:hypothetical protein GTP90_33860, partial [Rugamonas sp. FT81W]|nr:hypothetical protein [Duganella vulcania]